MAGAALALGLTYSGRVAQGGDLRRLLDEPAGLAELAHDPGLRSVLDAALHGSFAGILVVAALAVAAAWLLPASPAENVRGA